MHRPTVGLVVVLYTILALHRSDAEMVPTTLSTNHASAYLGAKVVEHSPEAKGVHHLLKDDQSYAIVPCSVDQKRFTIQLARDIAVRAVSLQSLEYFSSIVERFVLLGSPSFPCLSPCRWFVLGRFTANFTREHQLFMLNTDVATPAVRYLRFLWVSHYGKEKSCTLTTVQVYGQDRWDFVLPVVEDLVPQEEEPEVDADSVPASPSASFSTPAVGPSQPAIPWWHDTTTSLPLNLSHCPSTSAAKAVAIFLDGRLLTATCPANLTKPASSTGHSTILQMVGDTTQLIAMQRHIAALRRNVSALQAATRECASSTQLRLLAGDLARLRAQVHKSEGEALRMAFSMGDVQASATRNAVLAGVTTVALGFAIAGLVLCFIIPPRRGTDTVEDTLSEAEESGES